MMADFYSVLGVVKDASEDEIKKVYKMLVRKWHPDKNRDNQKEATIKMQQICEAYLILGDGEKRTYYDMKMMFGEDEKNESEEENESYESDEATDDEDVEEDETGYESSKSKNDVEQKRPDGEEEIEDSEDDDKTNHETLGNDDNNDSEMGCETEEGDNTMDDREVSVYTICDTDEEDNTNDDPEDNEESEGENENENDYDDVDDLLGSSSDEESQDHMDEIVPSEQFEESEEEQSSDIGCKLCGKACYSTYALKRHMWMMHGYGYYRAARPPQKMSTV